MRGPVRIVLLSEAGRSMHIRCGLLRAPPLSGRHGLSMKWWDGLTPAGKAAILALPIALVGSALCSLDSSTPRRAESGSGAAPIELLDHVPAEAGDLRLVAAYRPRGPRVDAFGEYQWITSPNGADRVPVAAEIAWVGATLRCQKTPDSHPPSCDGAGEERILGGSACLYPQRRRDGLMISWDRCTLTFREDTFPPRDVASAERAAEAMMTWSGRLEANGRSSLGLAANRSALAKAVAVGERKGRR